MRTTLLSGVCLACLLFSFAPVRAEVIKAPERIANFQLLESGGGGASGMCTIQYYNVCAGWIWTYSGWKAGDRVGVVFDLTGPCGSEPGDGCCNTAFWWYWRHTTPSRGFTISFSLWNVDDQNCLVAPPVGELGSIDIIERWNSLPGLGCFHDSRVAIVAEWDYGILPYVATENRVSNEGVPTCAGVVYEGNSFRFSEHPENPVYCPPVQFTDAAGPVDLIVTAAFSCSPTSVETTSWGDVKGLFR